MKAKQIILIACLMLLSGTWILSAQSRIGGVTIGEPVVEKAGETITVRFRATIDKKAVRRNHSLALAPELTGGSSRWSLPAIIVQGRGSKVLLARQILASGNEDKLEGVTFVKNGETIEYLVSVPYQQWMDSAELSVEALLAGCCSAERLAPQTLAHAPGLVGPAEPVSTPQTQPVAPASRQSIGDQLAEAFPFVSRVDDPRDIRPMSVEERDNTITIYYKVGRSDILPDYADNYRSLTDMLYSIRKIDNSADSDVAAIVVAGFASPEGSLAINDRLAGDRAEAVKRHILRNSGIPSDKIIIHNGQSDWEGLRKLVEASDMPRRDVVLAIIDSYPIWDPYGNVGRLGQLMRLDGGIPYRYMLDNFFPQLRNAAYIKVYYTNK